MELLIAIISTQFVRPILVTENRPNPSPFYSKSFVHIPYLAPLHIFGLVDLEAATDLGSIFVGDILKYTRE